MEGGGSPAKRLVRGMKEGKVFARSYADWMIKGKRMVTCGHFPFPSPRTARSADPGSMRAGGEMDPGYALAGIPG